MNRQPWSLGSTASLNFHYPTSPLRGQPTLEASPGFAAVARALSNRRSRVLSTLMSSARGQAEIRCTRNGICERTGSKLQRRKSFRRETTRAIDRADFTGSSCSHTMIGFHPASRSLASVSASLEALIFIFFDQYSTFVFGIPKWSGHACQKHPWTKTATRAGRNTMSARRLNSASGRALTR